MRIPMLRGFAIRAGACIAAGSILSVAAGSDTTTPEETGQAILASAFERRHGADFTSTIELIIRNGTGQELRRRFVAASKTIDGRVHSLGRLVWPEYLRGMTILSIEAEGREQDTFVYMPSMQKVRRVSTAQRRDSFLGSDVTYQDLERQRIEDYELNAVSEGEWVGERVVVVTGRPLHRDDWASVEFVIAASDGAILESRYFKRGRDAPDRIISASRAGVVQDDGRVFPTNLLVRNLSRGTTTEVQFLDFRFDPTLDDELFSTSSLEQQRDIHPGARSPSSSQR